MNVRHRAALAVTATTLALGCHAGRARSADESQVELTSAETNAEQRETGASVQERTRAHDRLVRERATTYAGLQQRLAEIDKRAHDAHATSADLDPEKKSEFDRAWYAYTAEHRDVEQAMRSLATSPDVAFGTWTERTKVQLDELERAATDLSEGR